MNLAAESLEPQIAQAGIDGSHQLSDCATLGFDPNCSRERKRIIVATQLECGRRSSARNSFEIDLDVGDTIHALLAAGIERKARLIARMHDEQHAGEAIRDEQGARRIAECGLAGVTGFH